ncbi:MAG TPA: hypothetical protein VLW50_34060 [Streptosporangiaceae bacterium]|nr:hypothetical protein [Streptosporangiaceae bacterium]
MERPQLEKRDEVLAEPTLVRLPQPPLREITGDRADTTKALHPIVIFQWTSEALFT